MIGIGGQTKDRAHYLAEQIARSNEKFALCKVRLEDALRYRRVIEAHRRGLVGPMLCLGTRNGGEVDYFRRAFRGRWIMRSAVNRLHWRSVVGVEVNPRGKRKDVWCCSFDELPAHWTAQFDVLYSNALDHAYCLGATTREWKRVLKPNGYLILAFTPNAEPEGADRWPLSVTSIREWFGGNVIFMSHRGSSVGYSEVILHFPER